MEPTERFIEFTGRGAGGGGAEPSLDVWAALIGAAFDRRARYDVVERVQHELDRRAAACDATFESVLEQLFGAGERSLTGNTSDYGDPRNSFLHQVLDRQLGIPITLSVVAIEVGRRKGVPVAGVGLPGHFIIACGPRFADPFRGPEVFAIDEVEERWRRNTGLRQPLDPRWLVPVSPRSIVLRMLNNLKQTFVALDDPVALHSLARMRGAFPELVTEQAEYPTWMRHWN